jgi:DNA-binding transcriptional ArsR family regulator
MKPLVHPAIEDVPVQAILHALADPVRVALFVEILNQESPENCTRLVTLLDKPVPKSTLSQHLRILREAGLIRGERQGVQMRNTSRLQEVDARYPGLLLAIVTAHTIETESRKRKRKARTAHSTRTQ